MMQKSLTKKQDRYEQHKEQIDIKTSYRTSH